MYQQFKKTNLVIRYLFTLTLLVSLCITNLPKAKAALNLNYCENTGTDGRLEDPNLLDMVCVTVRIINVAVLFSGTVLVITFCYGAIKIAMSVGDPKGTQAGRTTVFLSAGGFLIVIGFNTVYRVIVVAFNLSSNYSEPDKLAELILNGICSFVTNTASKPIVEIQDAFGNPVCN